jgi:hypothetical protein
MNRTELMEIDAKSVAALGEYFVEAQRTAAMLAECTEEPPSFKERFNLMSQGIVEHDDHLTYLGIKSRLYEVARLGYGISN